MSIQQELQMIVAQLTIILKLEICRFHLSNGDFFNILSLAMSHGVDWIMHA